MGTPVLTLGHKHIEYFLARLANMPRSIFQSLNSRECYFLAAVACYKGPGSSGTGKWQLGVLGCGC